MTKKDYELIASSIKDTRLISQESKLTEDVTKVVMDVFSEIITKKLSDDNPRFNKEIFIKASNIN